MRPILIIGTLLAASFLSACVGGKSTATASPPVVPTVNTMTLTVDTGPAAANGQINHAYVTVKVCVPGSKTQCANIDHVLLDTGSVGLRLVGSVLTAAAVTLTPETDSNNLPIEECLHLGGGDLWGPVALADVTLAGEVAAKLPVQIMDDSGPGNTGTPPPPTGCGTNGPILNPVSGFGANGVLGVGVFAQDCEIASCVNSATQTQYYGCAATGVCTLETNLAAGAQVPNPVALFATDNNGIIVNLPNPISPNGDVLVTGELVFGLATQSDNALPATGLNVLGTDSNGDFTAMYNGGTTTLKALIDSGTDAYTFYDPSIPTCSAPPDFPAFVGYYCPPNSSSMSLFATNAGVGVNNGSNTVNFTIDNPISFQNPPPAAAFAGLASPLVSTNRLTWGMPFFYGRKIYIAIDQKTAGTFKGPFFAY